MLPSVPLPFVIALLLAILLGRLVSQREPHLRPAIVFVGACAALVSVVGLRWSFDLQVMRFVQPIVASSLPPIAWSCFAKLIQPRRAQRLWPHAIPVVVVALLSAIWPRWHPPIDLVLAGLFFGYGFALLRMGSGGPDGLGNARLAEAGKAHKATVIVGLVLAVSGAVDLLIAWDFDLYDGRHAASIVAVANLIALPLIAYAMAIVGSSVSGSQTAGDGPEVGVRKPAQSEPSTASDAVIVDTVDRLMRDKQLFRDPDLTLNRLARQAGVPARQVSMAINRVHDKNVSQLVNGYRVEEAKRLLAGSELPVTSLMFEAGFQTKSNFNREFRRLTGMTPSDYRRKIRRGRGDDDLSLAGSPRPGMR